MSSVVPSQSGQIGLGLRTRLSIMMFLQYYVWGIWLPMLYQFLSKEGNGITDGQIGWIFSVYGLGAIVGPFVVGQIADRYLATEKVLCILHFVGGLLLIATAYFHTFVPIFLLLLAYCTLYMPSMGLTNSLTFRSLGEGNQNSFPGVRLWGTLGWIAAGLSFAAYMEYKTLDFYRSLIVPLSSQATFDSFLGWWQANVVPGFESLHKVIGQPRFGDCLRVAGAFSILYSVYCLTLPHTPPVPAKASDPLDKRSAVLESLELMRNRSFAVLVTIAGLIGIMLAFYFACENKFLEHIGAKPEQTSAIMTIGQVAELVLMGLVPLSVARLGIKTTMLIGGAAWAIRFGLSAIGQPYWLMVSTIALHGFAFGFFFVPAQMYVDRSATQDIKASAQSLLIFVIYGLGTVVGSILAGQLMGYFKDDWRGVWSGPFVLTMICLLAFAALFREEAIRKPAASHQPRDLA